MSHREIEVLEHGSYAPWKYWVQDHVVPGIGHVIQRHDVAYVIVMVHWKPVDGGALRPTFIVQRADQLQGLG